MAKNSAELVAPCGLYCGDCHGYQQKIPDLSRDLRKELRGQRYDLFAAEMAKMNFGKGFKDYDICYKVLGQMVKFRCHKGCRKGGGNPFCKIRKCVDKKECDGCWECSEFESCKKLDVLNSVHGDAHVKNLRRLKKNGKNGFAKGKRDWYSKPK